MKPITAAEQKADLRREIKAALAALTPEERAAGDALLFARFLSLPQVKTAQQVMLFAGMGSEPDTMSLIAALLQAGKAVALPRCLSGHNMEARIWDGAVPLVRHPLGMLEPSEQCPVVPPEELDLILAPALCYDTAGRRLGHGGGFYDRFLARCGCPVAGLCRDAVLQQAVPSEKHDLPVSIVVTETRIYETRPPEGGPASDGSACVG